MLEDTLKDLKNEDVALLEERNDIDDYEDLEDIAELQQFLPEKFQKN